MRGRGASDRGGTVTSTGCVACSSARASTGARSSTSSFAAAADDSWGGAGSAFLRKIGRNFLRDIFSTGIATGLTSDVRGGGGGGGGDRTDCPPGTPDSFPCVVRAGGGSGLAGGASPSGATPCRDAGGFSPGTLSTTATGSGEGGSSISSRVVSNRKRRANTAGLTEIRRSPVSAKISSGARSRSRVNKTDGRGVAKSSVQGTLSSSSGRKPGARHSSGIGSSSSRMQIAVGGVEW